MAQNSCIESFLLVRKFFEKVQCSQSGFSQIHNIGNNANIDISFFTMSKKTKKFSKKMLPQVGIEPLA